MEYLAKICSEIPYLVERCIIHELQLCYQMYTHRFMDQNTS